MTYPGRNNIYEATIKRMVNEALKAREQEFARDRAQDSDEQLLHYLRSCAQRLGHTPWPREIVGGLWIQQRFGTWDAALMKAKLPRPTTPDNLTSFPRYREERTRQEEVYRRKKAEKKLRAQQRQAKKKQPV